MNTLLALETGTRLCSVALMHEGEVRCLETETPQAHARSLLPMINEMLVQANLTPERLDALVLGKGPGAFTGLRIATAVTQGLALGWDVPVIGLSGLEALAWWRSRSHDGPVVAALDARMGECYAACYSHGECLWSAELMTPEVLGQRMVASGVTLGVGDAVQAFAELRALCSWEVALPSARHLVEMAVFTGAGPVSLHEALPVPLYLRNQVADKPKEKG